MRFFTFYVTLLMLIWNVECGDGEEDASEETLIFAQIIYRHGDRTIVEAYPTDPYKNKTYWPEGWGQLTNVGKEQHYELGQYFRRRYKSLLGDGEYSPDIVHVQSTDVDRTLMSAQVNLAGMFPPDDHQSWSADLKWQPIPVHTIPESQDYVLAGKKRCNKYDWAEKKFRESDEYLDLIRKYADLYAYLETHSGRKMSSPTDVLNLYDTLRIEHLKNFTLPDWTKEVFPDGGMKDIAERSFQLETYTPVMARLKIGFLVKEIFERARSKSKCYKTLTQNLWVYSAHDITIANFLNALGLFDLHCPPYRSSVLVELYELNHEYSIKIFYKNSSSEDLRPLDIPNCGQSCELGQIFKIYKDILPESDFNTECKTSVLTMTYEDADLNGTQIGIIGFAIFVVASLVLVPVIYFNHRSRSAWMYTPL